MLAMSGKVSQIVPNTAAGIGVFLTLVDGANSPAITGDPEARGRLPRGANPYMIELIWIDGP